MSANDIGAIKSEVRFIFIEGRDILLPLLTEVIPAVLNNTSIVIFINGSIPLAHVGPPMERNAIQMIQTILTQTHAHHLLHYFYLSS